MKITVTGASELKLPAECAVVSLTVSLNGADRADIVARTAAIVDQVRDALTAAIADGAGRDLRLSNLRMWTNVLHDDRGRQGETQHVAEVRGTVTFDDLSRLGDVLGGLSVAEGVNVNHVSWELREETMRRLQPEALRAAYADATTRATWIAEAAGFTTVTVASVQDNGRQAYRGAGKAAMFMDMGGSVPSIRLDPEDVDVSADLTIRFRAS